MKSMNLFLLGATVLGAAATASANTGVRYELTIKNGSPMPISPAAVYVGMGTDPMAEVGSKPTAGFVQLCQTGNPATRASELMSMSGVSFVTQSASQLMPGQSATVDVEVADPLHESIHFETMYGETKDSCGVAGIGSQALSGLFRHEIGMFNGKDEVVSTGAYLSPMVPPMASMTGAQGACAGQSTAVSCLRVLAAEDSGEQSIHYFAPYLPSVVDYLETKYGSAQVQPLLLSGSGNIQFALKLEN